jgi:transcriptional regulator with XRE-family HTH domain
MTKRKPNPQPVGRPRTERIDLSAGDVMIGRRLRLARERARLSVDEAADQCGVSRAQWYRMEAGEQVDFLARLARILDVLGCGIRDLVP